MKRLLAKLLGLVCAALLTVPLTSCEDEMIADTLQGTWEGNMYVSTSWDGRRYTATDTKIEFLLDPFRYTKGSGYWVDYYSGAPWDYVACHIDWRVDDEVITIYFREEGTTVYIEDYYLSDNRFRGTLIDGSNRVQFNLQHTSSPNWSAMTWWDYDDWYSSYARTRALDAKSAKPARPSRHIGLPCQDRQGSGIITMP